MKITRARFTKDIESCATIDGMLATLLNVSEADFYLGVEKGVYAFMRAHREIERVVHAAGNSDIWRCEIIQFVVFGRSKDSHKIWGYASKRPLENLKRLGPLKEIRSSELHRASDPPFYNIFSFCASKLSERIPF